MWKDFFYFTKEERRGIMVLILLINVVWIGGYIYSLRTNSHEEAFSKEVLEQYETFLASVIEEENRGEQHFTLSENPQTKSELFIFDPNTADSLDFVRLGLEPFVIKNILKYRLKGGVFRKREDFSRMYGMSPDRYQQLYSSIHIKDDSDETGNNLIENTLETAAEEEEFQKKESFIIGNNAKYTYDTLFNLNTVDTIELQRIPGIGSGISKAIVSYRNRLGGFYTITQLQDMEFIPDTLNKWFFIEENPKLASIHINQAGMEKLTSHPYLNFYQSKVIYEYRRKKGKLKSLKELSLFEEFESTDLERLEPYISF